ncbi:hypothetical protein TNCV_4631251 [Trichonephila clavipes]|nr:hypothetical protein TNCV_4631251 [Trichonephila clavipes]
MQINLEVDSDDAQELLDSHNQELTIDELIEIHEQEQDVESLGPSSFRRLNDGWELDRKIANFSACQLRKRIGDTFISRRNATNFSCHDLSEVSSQLKLRMP